MTEKQKVETDDRFKLFGTVSFMGVSKVCDFVGYLKEGKVMGTKCRDCGKKYFPPRADCPSCLGGQMQWFEVKVAGRLITFTNLKYAPAGFESDLPYKIAVVDFGDYKIFGRISGQVPDDEIKIGMQLRVKSVPLPEGKITYEFVK